MGNAPHGIDQTSPPSGLPRPEGSPPSRWWDAVVASASARWHAALLLLRTPRNAAQAWVALLVAGVLAIVVYYLLPRAGVAQAVVLCVINASGAVAALRAAAGSRGLSRLVWSSLGVGITFETLANVPYYSYPLLTGRPTPFPSPVDALWLLMYPCFVVALLALARHRSGADHAGNLLDSAILIAGGGILMWEFALAPAVHSTGLAPLAHLVSVLYPTMDLIVFAMLVRLLVGSPRNGSMRLLVASFVALLVSDLIYAVELSHGTYHFGGPTDGLWMLSYLLIGVAALHPTARSFPQGTAPTGYRITRARLLFLSAALLVGPIMVIARPHDATFAACTSAASFLLVIARMTWLNRGLAAASLVVENKTEQLRHQALHDALTGLPNRALIMDRIEQLLVRNRRNRTTGAAMFVDLDDFKNVNDTLGHGAGDRLLVAVAARLASTLRDADTIGRMGGDEFVVLIDGATLDVAPELVAERLLDVMHQPFDLDEASLPLMVSISIGIATGDRSTAGELLRDADVALYQAKAAGKNRYEIFHPEMHTKISRRTDLEFDLRSALAADQFRLVYQPIYNLDDLTVIGVEALLRWDHPTQGLIMPDEFIPILEQTGQIREVGRWVQRTACQQMATWHARGDTLDVSVNVSARQLDHDSIIDDIRDALHVSGLDAKWLIIEVTETALMHNVEATARRLHAIKELGVRIAVDDFGTGYSSLAYLRRFPVDCIKIDRMFTNAVTSSPESKALIRTLVQLGKDLGLTTLAEGIETTDEMDALRGASVDQAQGFLMARPLSPEALETQLLAPTRPVTPSSDRRV
jgi:diguanylate cyclase